MFCGRHSFRFDHVYGSGGSSPTQLFSDCIEPLVQGIFSGYNATVFAYGQTGSGKTYTMGSQVPVNDAPAGVIPDALGSMFAKIDAAADTSFRLRVGFTEIHKEVIHDLLLTPGMAQPNIQLREMTDGSMCIAGATEIEIDLSAGAAASRDRVLEILMQVRTAHITPFQTQTNLACSLPVLSQHHSNLQN